MSSVSLEVAALGGRRKIRCFHSYLQRKKIRISQNNVMKEISFVHLFYLRLLKNLHHGRLGRVGLQVLQLRRLWHLH